MKRTVFLCLLLWVGSASTYAFSEKSDSTGLPITQQFTKRSLVQDFSILSLFEESESFQKGNFIVGLGYGLKSNIGFSNKNNEVQLPPVSLLLEMPIFQNVGLGLSLGAMRWAKDTDTENVYGYYTVSPTLAYHLNLGEKIDLYSGVVATGRLSAVKINDGNKLLKKSKFDIGGFVGMRLYLNQTLGAFLEYGSHNVSCFRLGLAFKFGN